MAENRTSHDHNVIGYIVHYVMWNGSSVTQHDHTDFPRRARRKADEIQKKDHIFGDYLKECTQGCMLSPGHTFLFNSLQRRSPLYNILCIQPIDVNPDLYSLMLCVLMSGSQLVRQCEVKHKIFYLLLLM
jgi:hypothetical protein